MKKKTLVRAAMLFDMDGVITNTMPDHFAAWKLALATEGIPVTHHDIYSREGAPGMSALEEVFDRYGKKLTAALAARILQRKETAFRKIVRIRFIVGSRTFVRAAAKDGFLLALVTGTSRHELHRILPENIQAYFKVIVTGDDVTKGKPNPEPYLRALEKLALQASDAVAFENAPFGIQSAKAAGLHCLALETSLSRDYLSGADEIFSSFAEMQKRVSFSRKM